MKALLVLLKDLLRLRHIMGDIAGVMEPALVRLLIINPNTSVSMTDALKPMIDDLGYENVGHNPHLLFIAMLVPRKLYRIYGCLLRKNTGLRTQ